MKNIISVLLALCTLGAYAGNNPYAFFSAEDNATTATVSATATPTTSSSTTTVSPTTTAASAPNIQYVQPASQVGNISSTNNVNPKVFSNTPSTNAQNNTSLGMLGPGGTQNSTGSMLGPGGTLSPMLQTNGILQQIADNTKGSKNSNKSLLDYWTALPSPGDTFLSEASGYNVISQLSQQDVPGATLRASMGSNFNLPILQTANQGATGTNGKDSIVIPYLDDLTAGSQEQSSAWTAAVNQTLLDLYGSASAVQSMRPAVMAPFGGQSAWLTQVQKASTPQLLRMLVIQQAMQNYMTYQALQRQEDQALMQAASLKLLADLKTTLNQNSDAQINEDLEIRKAIQILADQNGSGN